MQDTAKNGKGNRMSPRGGAKFFHCVIDMKIRAANGNGQMSSDFLAALAIGNQQQYVTLAVRKQALLAGLVHHYTLRKYTYKPTVCVVGGRNQATCPHLAIQLGMVFGWNRSASGELHVCTMINIKSWTERLPGAGKHHLR